jgi:D-proline reductase (dithiol) PrdB
MTTGISLVRENTVSMQPPRALWVSFPLGRPLGKPGDSAFQHRVIDAALGLLKCASGPVLMDFPEDAPEIVINEAPACPVSFARPVKDTSTWKAALIAELQNLIPWHDLGKRKRNGRTLVGLSEFSPAENLEKLGQLLDNDQLPTTELKWFKAAIEDLKVYYIESLTAQPGSYNANQIEDVFWQETALGAALLKFATSFQTHPALAGVSRIIAPRSATEKHQDRP